MLHQRIKPRRRGLVVVAATGPSLTPDIAEACRGVPVIAINDAYRLFPWAEALYACDGKWWDVHEGCPKFLGEKWSSHSLAPANDKRPEAERYGLNLVEGRDGAGFSFNAEFIHYGSNSGFQGVNLALLKGGNPIALVGFDMRCHGRQRHFFGDHPAPLNNRADYGGFVGYFDAAAERLPAHVKIWNCTPGSALTCFPQRPLTDVLREVEYA